MAEFGYNEQDYSASACNLSSVSGFCTHYGSATRASDVMPFQKQPATGTSFLAVLIFSAIFYPLAFVSLANPLAQKCHADDTVQGD